MTSPTGATNAMDSIASTVQSIASTTLNAITTTASSSGPSQSPSSSSSSSSSTTTEGFTTTTTTGEKLLSVGDLSSSLQHFGWMDYFVFVLMLVVCAVIGFYFGFVEKKGKGKGREQRRGSEALDYLVGGRKMKVFPVSLSLVASFVSGISLLGTSTEIYVYGTQYAFIILTISLSAIISWYIFLPVFCNLQLTSTYEYFERRFDRRLQLFGALLFIMESIFWLPIAIYVPALTFNQVTGIDIHIITPVVCLVCTFYTCVGGIKAVVFADFLQSFVMFGSIFMVMIKGTWDVGGIGVVWQRNRDSGRLEFPEMTLDPTVRMSVLAVFIGGTFYRIQNTAISQPAVQRFVSLPSIKKIKQTLILFSLGLTVLLFSCVYVGLVTFATYYDCDPFTTKLAKARDQLVPLLVMDVLGEYPGLSGLFVSAVFSAALSSLSTVLNSLSAVILEDFAKPFSRHSLTETQTAILMRGVVILFGTVSIGLVYVVEKLGMVLQLSATLQSITQGPMFGIFFVGICMPRINSRSVLTGSILSFAIMGWICIRAQFALVTQEIILVTKPVSIEGCTYDFERPLLLNSTLDDQPDPEFAIHQISWLWYVALGAVLTVIGSVLASFVFGRIKPEDVDPDLVAPFLQKYYKPKKYESVSKVDLADD